MVGTSDTKLRPFHFRPYYTIYPKPGSFLYKSTHCIIPDITRYIMSTTLLQAMIGSFLPLNVSHKTSHLKLAIGIQETDCQA